MENKPIAICTGCHKEFEPDTKPNGTPYKTCPRCRKSRARHQKQYSIDNKERYYWLKKKGICVSCGREYAEPGRVRCAQCRKKTIESQKKYDPDHSKRYARREAKKNAGLCIDCGRPTVNGHLRCPRCIEMRRDSDRKFRIIKKIEREARKAREGTPWN